MAKVTPGKDAPGRGKSLRGRVVFRTNRGLLVAQKWPRPRGQPKTEQHKQQVEWFRQAQQLAKRADPKTQATIRQAVHRSPLMPRDLATSLMAGRAYSLARGPRDVIRSIRAMTEVSKALDLISNSPGDTLIRGASTWVGAPLPMIGPSWLNPAPELAWTLEQVPSSFAWKGTMFTAVQPTAIGQLGAILDLDPAATYRAAIATLDLTDQITSILYSLPTVPGREGREFVAFDLNFVANTNDRVAMIVGRTDATGTYALPTLFLDAVYLPLPGRAQGWCRAATILPAIGDTITTGTTGTNTVFPRASF